MNPLILAANRGMVKYYSLALCTITLLSNLALRELNQQTDQLIGQRFHNDTLLVIAHPDDETMFFGPTVLSLTSSQKHLNILCLSSGNAEGLGRRRVLEMKSVVETLGERVKLDIVDDISLSDGMDEDWDIRLVKHYIENHIRELKPTLKQIISFDESGISNHSNHRAIYRALQLVAAEHHYWNIDFLVLETVSTWRKYTSFLDALYTVIANHLSGLSPTRLTISIEFQQYKALRNILSLHVSQMVWFRQLYMIFSRYMFINDLRRMNDN